MPPPPPHELVAIPPLDDSVPFVLADKPVLRPLALVTISVAAPPVFGATLPPPRILVSVRLELVGIFPTPSWLLYAPIPALR